MAESYNQLQAVMPVLEDLVQPEEIREAAPSYTPSSALTNGAKPRYRFEKRSKEAWAVLDRHDGDALLAITKYKKGAQALIERLEAYEQRIADLSHTPPHPLRAGDNPSPPART
jgi:hypothetical protein